MHADRHFVMGILEAGANGYLLKDSAFAELITAVTAVAKGKTYLSPSIAETVIESSLEKSDRGETGLKRAAEWTGARGSPNDRGGKIDQRIAFRLFVSTKTVETHRKQIMDKLSIRTVAGLTKYAIREGLTSLGKLGASAIGTFPSRLVQKVMLSLLPCRRRQANFSLGSYQSHSVKCF